MAEQFDYDYIVIGSGFGGSVSALRLAEKGYSVAVLEMGKRFQPEDFATTNWNLKRFLWFPKLLCYGIQQITLLKDVLIFHGAGVGGGSLIYANTLPIPPDGVFDDPRWPTDEDWKAKLAPHYELAYFMLGVTEATEMFNSDFLLKEICEERGRGDTFKKHQVAVHFGTPNESGPDPFFGGEGPDENTHIELVRYGKGQDFMGMNLTHLTGGGPPWPRLLRWLGNFVRHSIRALRAVYPFGYDDFYIADGSIVPANLGVNPALMITALSEHIMAGIPDNPEGTTKPAPRPSRVV